jgi:hypothetical protein
MPGMPGGMLDPSVISQVSMPQFPRGVLGGGQPDPLTATQQPGAPGGLPTGMPGNMFGGMPGGMFGGMPGGMFGGMPGSLPSGVPFGAPIGMRGG